MAGEVAQFFIRLGTLFDDKGFKQAADSIKGIENKASSVTSSIRTFGAAIGAAGLGAGIVKFGMDSLNAFAESERAANRLAGAMRNLGVYTRDAFEEQTKFAGELQATTTFSDEEVMSAQALLTTYGLYGEKLKAATRAVLDLATGKNLDLRTATIQLGKAFDGETGRLAMLGIHFTDTGSKAKNFEQILKAVSGQVGGAAAAELNTYAGRVKNLANNFDELKEKIGRELVPAAEFWVEVLKKASVASANLLSSDSAVLKGKQQTIRTLSEEINSTRSAIERIEQLGGATARQGAFYKEQTERLEKLTKTREKAIAALKAEKVEVESVEKKPTRERTDETESAATARRAKEKKDAEQSQERMKLADTMILQATKTSTEIELINTESLARQLEAEGKHAKAKELLATRGAQLQKRIEAEKRDAAIANTASALSFMSGAWKQHTAAYKASAMSLALINTYQAYTAALTIPVVGKFLAAAVLASGLAMVSNIAGVQLAQGGLVRRRDGGIMATIGEGGSDEAVLPLSDGGVMRRIAGAILQAAGPRMALAGAGVGSPIQVNQVFNMGAGGGYAPGSGVTETMERIREATRDGVAEALDLARQLYRTGAAEGSRA